ncbi:signal peptidase I [Fictibacillus halophilus]|uniref:signal peptidase I n=1 Tax=Fictibacillus halophilus TaxID=1610490 RepID=UPI00362E582D
MQVNQVTVDLVRRVVKKKGSILLPAHGKSMFPFIRQGDICHFDACDPKTYKRGDIVLFTVGSNRLIAHRFMKKIHKDNQTYYLFKGDTNLLFDEPITQEQILGKMTAIERKNKKVNLENVWSNIWSLLIINLPMMSKLLRKFIYRKGDFQY